MKSGQFKLTSLAAPSPFGQERFRMKRTWFFVSLVCISNVSAFAQGGGGALYGMGNIHPAGPEPELQLTLYLRLKYAPAR
jgi:hypothetical protein